MVCSEVDCDDPVFAKGFCKRHYYRDYQRRNGKVNREASVQRRRDAGELCTELGCDRVLYCQDLCERHYRQGLYEQNKAVISQRRKAARLADPDGNPQLLRERKWRTENRDRARANRSRWMKAHPERRRAWSLWSHYRLTPEQWDELFGMQGGLCAVCQKPKELVVDHDHETGVVRGLLCFGCNNGLGLLGDTVEGLQRAMAYLGMD